MKRWLRLAGIGLVAILGTISVHGYYWHGPGPRPMEEDSYDAYHWGQAWGVYHRNIEYAVYQGWIQRSQAILLHNGLKEWEVSWKKNGQKEYSWAEEEGMRQNLAAKAGLSIEELNRVFDGPGWSDSGYPYRGGHGYYGHHRPFPKG